MKNIVVCILNCNNNEIPEKLPEEQTLKVNNQKNK